MINALKLEIKKNLEEEIEKNFEASINVVVEEPKKTNLGDISIPLFVISKTLGKPLVEISSFVREVLEKNKMIKEINQVGGFINLFIDKEVICENILKEIVTKKDSFANSNIGEGKNIVIDYSSPNIAKPFSIGHLRSTIIGNSLKLIYKKLGYNVVGINHLGDWGTQFGKVIVAYKLWGSEEKVKENSLKELSMLYVKFHDEAKKDPKLEDMGREAFRRLEEKDPEYLQLWSWFREESLKESMNMYKLLDVSFDSYNGEAFFNDKMDSVVEELEEKNLLKEDQGALIVDLGEKMPPALIKRRDGATLYITRDLAALFYRMNNYHFDKAIYVVGNEQKLHFNQLKKVVEMMGYDFYKDIYHVNFGLVLQNGKKMSTRQGGVVTLYEVLMEAIKMASKVIEEKNPDLPDKEEVAKKIGIGAVMFNDLKNHRTLDIEFDLNQMLKFEGQTGPYLQYTSVRIKSILRENTFDISNLKPELFSLEQYFDVVRLLSQFGNTINLAANDNAPSVVARYLLSLAQAFNKFYAQEHILVSDVKVKNTNLALAYSVEIVLDEGMRLLGIKSLDRM